MTDSTQILHINEIIEFLGINNSDEFTLSELSLLKKDIFDMYKLLYDTDNDLLKESILMKNINIIINESFDINYIYKNHNINLNISFDDSIKKNIIMIKETSHNSDSFELNVNNIIETYQNISSEKESLVTLSNKSSKAESARLPIESNNIKIDINLTNFITVEQKDALYEEYIDKIKPLLNGNILKETQHYDFLRGLPQPVQKSPEWYELRNGMITASAAADILGESKYHTRDEMLLDKINLLPNKYQENMFVHHGKKYERIATMIYEYIYNTKVGEFGLVPYQNDHSDLEPINFIGASPDGISTCITLDGKPNHMVGRMLEIKCPLKRKILTEGEIDGGICPHYYWVQVQLQLACCKNETCDFWQCNLQEYSEDEWTMDNTEDGYSECSFTVEQNIKTHINPRLTRGCVIQLNPKTRAKVPKSDRIEWYAKYIYPSNLDMSTADYIEWSNYMEHEWKTLYPEYVDDYTFDKVLYWKLMNCHNLLIKRNIEWFNSKVPPFKQFWKEVLELRRDTIKGQQLLDKYMAKKNKYKDAKDAREAKYTATKQVANNPLDDSLFLSDEAPTPITINVGTSGAELQTQRTVTKKKSNVHESLFLSEESDDKNKNKSNCSQLKKNNNVNIISSNNKKSVQTPTNIVNNSKKIKILNDDFIDS